MPFGITSAPRLFTLLMRQAAKYLCNTLGIRRTPNADKISGKVLASILGKLNSLQEATYETR